MALQIIYDKILDFPVFQGLGKMDLADMVEKTKFYFHKCERGEVIVRNGEECNNLHFLLQGKVTCVRSSDDYGYVLSEDLPAPLIFQSESLFGHSQYFTRDYIAATDVGLMTLDKTEVLRFLDRYPIVRINIINQFATNVQKLSSLAWKHQSADVEQRIVDFIVLHCLRPSGRKEMKIKMNQLAHELNDSRLNVSVALNRLQEQNLLELYRGRIVIPAMERLINRFTLKNE